MICKIVRNENNEVISILNNIGNEEPIFAQAIESGLSRKEAYNMWVLSQTPALRDFYAQADNISTEQTTQKDSSAEQITQVQQIIDYIGKRLKTDLFAPFSEFNAKLKSLGYDSLQAMVDAWHGSPHNFDRFTTDKMGTGEGNQAFGWGLYFTSVKEIAEEYGRVLSKKEEGEVVSKISLEKLGLKENEISDLKYSIFRIDNYAEARPQSFYIDYAKSLRDSYKKSVENSNDDFYKLQYETYKKLVPLLESGEVTVAKRKSKLYKVSLHKGKEVGEYTWLEWDKSVNDSTILKLARAFNIPVKVDDSKVKEIKKQIEDAIDKGESNLLDELDLKLLEAEYNFSKNGIEPIVSEIFSKQGINLTNANGEFVYEQISRKLKSDKGASLFLLENGIDGIKYPAESISRGATSDTARGFNYVVFDENAITIEEKIQFLKTPKGVVLGFVSDGKIYLNPNAVTPTTVWHELTHISQKVIKDLAKQGNVKAQAILRRWKKVIADNDVEGQIEKNFFGNKGKGTPTQFSMQVNGKTKQVKPIDAEVVNGFYSNTENALAQVKQEKMSGNAWKTQLLSRGANADEMKWTTLADYLEANKDKSVSKSDIANYLKENRVQLVEVVKSDDLVPVKLDWAKKEFDTDDYNATIGSNEGIEYVLEDEEVGYEIIKTDESFYVRDSRGENIFKDGDYNNEIKSLEDAKNVAGLNLAENNKRSTDDTKFSQYQLEGEKENYKEVLVTLPQAKSKQSFELIEGKNGNWYVDNKNTGVRLTFGSEGLARSQYDRLSSEKQVDWNKSFKSSHFDEPNILVHLRMNTRTDADGNKVLFLDEIQSDWGQTGKKEGFETPEKKAELKKLQDNASAATQKFNEIEEELNKQYSEKKKEGESRSDLRKRDSDFNKLAQEYAPAEQKMFDSRRAFDMFQVDNRGEVPTAPFVIDTNAWTKLGLKVALKEAVKQGADKIAWSTGTQQFDRWGSEEIHWNTVMKPKGFEIVVKDDAKRPLVRGSRIKSLSSSNDVSQDQQSEVKRLAEKWNLKPEDLEVIPSKGQWTLAINEQTDAQAFQGNEEALRSNKLEESDISVGTKAELRDAIKRNLSRERNEAEIDKLTDRIWNRMQNEDSGTSLPRKEGMEEFYGVPADMKRAKDFTIKKEGELFAVKDEKGKTIRTFKQENEANKFKENYGLGIVGNVAKGLFKQEPKSVEIFKEEEPVTVYQVYDRMRGNVLADFKTESEARSYIRNESEFGDDWGVTSETSDGAKGKSTRHSIDITPELKAEVQSGLPLFQAEGKTDRPSRIIMIEGNPVDLSSEVYDQAESESDADYMDRIMDEVWAYLESPVAQKLWEQKNGSVLSQVQYFINAVKEFFKELFDYKGKKIDNATLEELLLSGATNLVQGKYLESKEAPDRNSQKLVDKILSSELREFSLGYAPFREGNVKGLSDSAKVFQNKKYQQWLAMADQFANELGITVSSKNNTVGIYGITSADMEASAFVTVKGTEEQVRVFAALMGTLAPDSQDSVMLNTYDLNGEDTEHHVTFKTREDLENFLKNRKLYGISDISVNPATNTATILDINRYGVKFNIDKFLNNYGERITEHERRGIRNSFIEESSYGGIIQEARDTISGHNSGTLGQNLNDIYALAETRIRRQGGNYAKKSKQEKGALKANVYNYITKFRQQFNLTYPSEDAPSHKFSAAISKEIHDAYEGLKEDNSTNPEIKESYEQLAKEIDAQYQYMTGVLGIKVTFMENDPYDDSVHMMDDVYTNKHLRVFKGGEPHPFLDKKDTKGISVNEKFRAVHDYFGHAIEGNSFGKVGEEAAWAAHLKMFSTLARKAMTTETRGQNSWVNNNPINSQSLLDIKNGNDLINVGKITEGKALVQQGKDSFQFAAQKVDLLPYKYSNTQVGETNSTNDIRFSLATEQVSKPQSSTQKLVDKILSKKPNELEKVANFLFERNAAKKELNKEELHELQENLRVLDVEPKDLYDTLRKVFYENGIFKADKVKMKQIYTDSEIAAIFSKPIYLKKIEDLVQKIKYADLSKLQSKEEETEVTDNSMLVGIGKFRPIDTMRVEAEMMQLFGGVKTEEEFNKKIEELPEGFYKDELLTNSDYYDSIFEKASSLYKLPVLIINEDLIQPTERTELSDIDGIYIETSLPAHKMYEKFGLIKIGNKNIFEIVQPSENFLEELNEIAKIDNSIVPIEPTLQNITEYINNIARTYDMDFKKAQEFVVYDIVLNKGRDAGVSKKEVYEFVGDYQYLITKYLKDFTDKIGKEAEKNSIMYQKVLKYFKITENGLTLQFVSPTLKQDFNLLKDNSKVFRDLEDYAKISNTNITELFDLTPSEKGSLSYLLNNLQEVTEVQTGSLKDGILKVENINEPVVSYKGDYYQRVNSYRNSHFYQKINKNNSPYKQYQTEKFVKIGDLPFIFDKEYIEIKNYDKSVDDKIDNCE